MGDDTNDMEFQHDRSGSMMNCPSTGMSTIPLSEKVAGMPMCSMPLYKSCSGGDPFFAPGWDPIVSLNHSENFGGFAHPAYPVGGGNHGISSSSSQLVQYQSSDAALVDLVPKLSCFGSGSFSEMVNSFGLPEVGQAARSICTQSYTLNKEGGSEKPSTNSPLSQEERPNSRSGAMEDSPKRRKRILDPHSAANPDKHAEVEQVKDMSEDSSGFQKDQDDKKSIGERNPGSLKGKQSSKISKDNNSPSGEATKENYIHVRARRGQATNSHSLAERVRREKISERMRMLQELVPGCNKITGKAVMLDEIINYVQSLQQQVEFLSMKLATVNPEMGIDIERILSKDILQSRAGNGAFLGIGSGMTSSRPYPQGVFQATMPNIPNISPQFHNMPQNVWDNELRNLLQMGFNSNSTIDTIGLDGCSKPEM